MTNLFICISLMHALLTYRVSLKVNTTRMALCWPGRQTTLNPRYVSDQLGHTVYGLVQVTSGAKVDLSGHPHSWFTWTGPGNGEAKVAQLVHLDWSR